jgi:hypothetical protein
MKEATGSVTTCGFHLEERMDFLNSGNQYSVLPAHGTVKFNRPLNQVQLTEIFISSSARYCSFYCTSNGKWTLSMSKSLHSPQLVHICFHLKGKLHQSGDKLQKNVHYLIQITSCEKYEINYLTHWNVLKCHYWNFNPCEVEWNSPVNRPLFSPSTLSNINLKCT